MLQIDPYTSIDEIRKKYRKVSAENILFWIFSSFYFRILNERSLTSCCWWFGKLSIYVHPDKNPNDRERAQVAFEAVNRAYKMLDDEKERKKCLEVVDEARVKVEEMVGVFDLNSHSTNT